MRQTALYLRQMSHMEEYMMVSATTRNVAPAAPARRPT
ncbi:hypothetical protein CVE36_00695, partial [Pseudomonas syringae pv. actinidiae]|nr:hypothetical protein [Pseudomonas syringae pv. actinidiae]